MTTPFKPAENLDKSIMRTSWHGEPVRPGPNMIRVARRNPVNTQPFNNERLAMRMHSKRD